MRTCFVINGKSGYQNDSKQKMPCQMCASKCFPAGKLDGRLGPADGAGGFRQILLCDRTCFHHVRARRIGPALHDSIWAIAGPLKTPIDQSMQMLISLLQGYSSQAPVWCWAASVWSSRLRKYRRPRGRSCCVTMPRPEKSW